MAMNRDPDFLAVRGVYEQLVSPPLPVRFSTNPAAFSSRITSFQLTSKQNNLTLGYSQCSCLMYGREWACGIPIDGHAAHRTASIF